MNRRETVRVLGIAIASALIGANGPSTLAAGTRRLLAQPLPPVDPENPSFEVFHRLSQWVTGHEDLDLEASRTLYPVFMAEPWGMKHIATAFTELHDALRQADGDQSVPALIQAGRLGEGETWFVSHLLTTWYLGVYYHETRTERLLYEGALMHRVVLDTHPTPGLSGREYGFWSEPPEHLVPGSK